MGVSARTGASYCRTPLYVLKAESSRRCLYGSDEPYGPEPRPAKGPLSGVPFAVSARYPYIKKCQEASWYLNYFPLLDCKVVYRYLNKKSSRNYKPGSVSARKRISAIYLKLRLPVIFSNLPLDIGRAVLSSCRYIWSCNPSGVLPENVAISAVGSYPAFSPLPRSYARRLFSVTLPIPLRTSFC